MAFKKSYLRILWFPSPKKIIAILFILWMVNGFAQVNIGSSFGVMIPGKQDLKYRYYQNGNLEKNLITNKVSSSVTSVAGINITYWIKKIGFDLRFLNWENRARGTGFTTSERPPFYKIDESRDALIFSFLRKNNFSFLNDSTKHKGFGYWGLGLGMTTTEVDPGVKSDIKICVQTLYGLSFDLTRRFSLFFEGRYLLTHDGDNFPESTFSGWLVDTSGHPALIRFGPHLDTRYYSISFGARFHLF